MSGVDIRLKINDVVMSKVMTEKGINGKTYVEGNCKVVSEEETFIMEFTYRGKSSEPSSQLHEYLYGLAQNEYRRRYLSSKEETLVEFANRKTL